MAEGPLIAVETMNNKSVVMISSVEVKENAFEYASVHLDKINIIDLFLQSLEIHFEELFSS